jgi:hypothetical protein
MLAELNIFIIESLSTFLGIDATFRRSSGLAIEPTSRADMIASICSHFDASCFLSPVGALDYHLRDELHAQMETEVVYQHFDHPEYEQLDGDFRSHLSAIDLLLNEVRESLELIRKGSKAPYTAEEALRKSEA